MTRPQPDETDHQRIVELLRSLGATDSEIEATPLDQRSALALDVVLRDGRPPVSLSDAAEAIGRPAEDLARLWRALGFASNNADALIPASLVDAQQILATSGTELLGREATLGLARVIGASTARLAEALVDSFRVSFELPELGRGTRYSDVVKDYVDITRVALPSFESMVIAAFRAHLVRVAGSAWMPDLHEAAARRTIAIGFADLVGYTALSRTLTAAELAQMLRRFEDGVNDVLAEHGGRLIKQIGDGVMFTAETADAGAAIALALAAAFSRTDDTPPVRVSLAWGVVLTHLGDYYGDVVNLAARLVALAKPGTVVISDDALAAMSDQWRTERLPDQALKGFGTPAAVHRLVG